MRTRPVPKPSDCSRSRHPSPSLGGLGTGSSSLRGCGLGQLNDSVVWGLYCETVAPRQSPVLVREGWLTSAKFHFFLPLGVYHNGGSRLPRAEGSLSTLPPPATCAAAEGRRFGGGGVPHQLVRAPARKRHTTLPLTAQWLQQTQGARKCSPACAHKVRRDAFGEHDSDHHTPLSEPRTSYPSPTSARAPSPLPTSTSILGVCLGVCESDRQRRRDTQRPRECNPQLFPQDTNDSVTFATHYQGNSVSVVFLIMRKPALLLLFIIYMT